MRYARDSPTSLLLSLIHQGIHSILSASSRHSFSRPDYSFQLLSINGSDRYDTPSSLSADFPDIRRTNHERTAGQGAGSICSRGLTLDYFGISGSSSGAASRSDHRHFCDKPAHLRQVRAPIARHHPAFTKQLLTQAEDALNKKRISSREIPVAASRRPYQFQRSNCHRYRIQEPPERYQPTRTFPHLFRL